MDRNPYERKIPKTWTVADTDKETDRLRRESRKLGDEIERIAGTEGYGKATTTLDVQVDDIKLALKKLIAYRDFWLKYKRRPSDAEVEAAIR